MTQSCERMSRVDAAWLRMDSQVNLMMIVGVWLLQPALDAAASRERLESRLLRDARLRPKVVQKAVSRTGSRTTISTSSATSFATG